MITLVALCCQGAASADLVRPGAGLAGGNGLPLFPALVGLPAGAWLEAASRPAAWAATAVSRVPLDARYDVLMMRAEGEGRGLMAVYAIRRDAGARCEGEIVHEPRALPDPVAAQRGLRRAGFALRRGFFSTPGAAFAADAAFYERRAGGRVERWGLARLPGGRVLLAESASYPVGVEAGLTSWLAEGREGVASFLARLATPAL